MNNVLNKSQSKNVKKKKTFFSSLTKGLITGVKMFKEFATGIKFYKNKSQSYKIKNEREGEKDRNLIENNNIRELKYIPCFSRENKNLIKGPSFDAFAIIHNNNDKDKVINSYK